MTSLTLFTTDKGLELVIDTKTGAAYATQAAYVRMSGKPKMTISDRLKGVREDETKTAEVLTPGGIQGVRLLPAKLVFKWLISDNPELAFAMGEAGATKFIQQLAGFKLADNLKPNVSSVPERVRYAELLLQHSPGNITALRVIEEYLQPEQQIATAPVLPPQPKLISAWDLPLFNSDSKFKALLMTRGELAKKLGVSRPSITKYSQIAKQFIPDYGADLTGEDQPLTDYQVWCIEQVYSLMAKVKSSRRTTIYIVQNPEKYCRQYFESVCQ